MLVRIANRENPYKIASSEAVLKKQSALGLHCLSSLFGRQLVFKILEHLYIFG